MAKFESIRKAICDWAQKTTLKVIQQVLISKSLLTKTIWTAFIIVSSMVMFQKIVKLVFNYFDYEVVSQIMLTEGQAAGGHVFLPVITFRLINWLDYYSYLKKLGKSWLTEPPENHLILNRSDPREVFIYAKNKFLAQYLIDHSHNDWNPSLILNKQLLSSEFVKCTFGEFNCTVDDFTFIQGQLNQAGYIQFNPRKFIKDPSDKPRTLKLQLFINKESHVSPVSSELGLEIFLSHENQLFMVDDNDENPILVRPGWHTPIKLEQTSIHLLPEPYNHCIDEKIPVSDGSGNLSLFQHTVDILGFYSQKFCFKICFQNALMRACKCYDHLISGYPPRNSTDLPSCRRKFDTDSDEEGEIDMPYLDPEDYMMSCPYMLREGFYAGDYVKRCHECPRECHREIYTPSISSTKFPSKNQLSILSHELGRNLSANEIISIEISMDSLQINYRQRPLKTFYDLIAELGEYLAMYMGMSILSSFEIIDLLVSIASVYKPSVRSSFKRFSKSVFHHFDYKVTSQQ